MNCFTNNRIDMTDTEYCLTLVVSLYVIVAFLTVGSYYVLKTFAFGRKTIRFVLLFLIECWCLLPAISWTLLEQFCCGLTLHWILLVLFHCLLVSTIVALYITIHIEVWSHEFLWRQIWIQTEGSTAMNHAMYSDITHAPSDTPLD